MDKIRRNKITSWPLPSLGITASCEEYPSDKIGVGTVKFSFKPARAKMAKTGKYDAEGNASKVVITIEDASGKCVFDHENVPLVKTKDAFISKPLSMEKGKYKLTEYQVLDNKDNVIYRTPDPKSDFDFIISLKQKAMTFSDTTRLQRLFWSLIMMIMLSTCSLFLIASYFR